MAFLMAQGISVLIALIFCIVRLIIDFRARRLGWAAAGLIVSGLLLWASLVPIPTHAVKVELPGNG